MNVLLTVILAVQMGGSARTARDKAEQLRLGFPLLLDRDSRATTAWHVTTLPTTFLIGPDGAIASKQVGEVDWAAAKVRERLDSLLRGARPGAR